MLFKILVRYEGKLCVGLFKVDMITLSRLSTL